ncbi:hypothetical protein M1116_00470 [Patescibacteria group bacterium]|nr:hypothetical protein [Patescibacteria group bacterium]
MRSPTLRLIFIIAILVIITQVIISLIYSNLILSLNNRFNTQRHTENNLKRDVEKLQNQFSDLTSINHFQNSSPSGELTPITNYLNPNE